MNEISEEFLIHPSKENTSQRKGKKIAKSVDGLQLLNFQLSEDGPSSEIIDDFNDVKIKLEHPCELHDYIAF